VSYSAAVATHEHANHVESKRLFPAAVPRDPDRSRPHELPLLPPVDSLDRVPKVLPTTRLDLYERYQPFPLRYQIEVPVSIPEASIQDSPSSLR